MTTTQDFPCQEDAVLTETGCIAYDDLTGDETILDEWDCTTDGNGICGPTTTVVTIIPETDHEVAIPEAVVEIGDALVIERPEPVATTELAYTGMSPFVPLAGMALILVGKVFVYFASKV